MRGRKRSGHRYGKRVAVRIPPLARLISQRDALQRAVARQAARADEADRAREREERIRVEVTAERDRLVAELASSADEEAFDYLFVVASGRSGSTLLQGLLNSIPGYLIRGENRSALYHLYKHYDACVMQREHASRGRDLTPRDPWYGMEQFPAELARAELRRLVVRTLLRPHTDSRVIGFKEIRWRQRDLIEYADFIRLVFPGARFVINSRDLDTVSRSKWWAERPDALQVLAVAEQRHAELADHLGPDAFCVRYEDYVGDPLRLKDLFGWLGEDFVEDRVRQVLAVRHSY